MVWWWRRRLFVWEGDLLLQLQQMLFSVSLYIDEPNDWVWKEDPSICFSVKSAYSFLQKQQLIVNSDELNKLVFKKSWECKAPQKCQLSLSVFCWIDYLPAFNQHNEILVTPNLELHVYFVLIIRNRQSIYFSHAHFLIRSGVIYTVGWGFRMFFIKLVLSIIFNMETCLGGSHYTNENTCSGMQYIGPFGL